ncbi:MAG: L-asparaginase, partial [Pseudomonas sp.]
MNTFLQPLAPAALALFLLLPLGAQAKEAEPAAKLANVVIL